MKMKTYRAGTFKGALEQIKSEWGPEAFVLTSKQVRAPGFSGLLGRKVFEVTAGLDRTPDPDGAEMEARQGGRSEAAQAPSRSTRRPREAAREYASQLPAEKPAQSPREREELAQLRRWIYGLTRLSQPPEILLLGEPIGELYDDLCANDVEPTIVKMLMNSACAQFPNGGRGHPGDLATYVSSLIEKLVTVKDASKRIKIFLGPTGVGKTTTVAKLAARALINHEGKVGLITTDTFRIGGAQQLRTYAEIMGAPVKVARSVPELSRLLDQWQGFDTVLIDTVGKSQRQLDEFADLAGLLGRRPDIEKHLILSATTKPLDIREIVEKFGLFSPDYLCFTKLDETTTFGSLLNEHNRTGKPLSYFGVGQKVPEDLEVATKSRVAELVMGRGM